MSDSSIPSDLVDKDIVKSRQVEERRQARLQEQYEWRRSNTLLCDCSSCKRQARLQEQSEWRRSNARELKADDVGESVRRPPVSDLPKQPDISPLKIPDIRSLFRVNR